MSTFAPPSDIYRQVVFVFTNGQVSIKELFEITPAGRSEGNDLMDGAIDAAMDEGALLVKAFPSCKSGTLFSWVGWETVGAERYFQHSRFHPDNGEGVDVGDVLGRGSTETEANKAVENTHGRKSGHAKASKSRSVKNVKSKKATRKRDNGPHSDTQLSTAVPVPLPAPVGDVLNWNP